MIHFNDVISAKFGEKSHQIYPALQDEMFSGLVFMI